MGRQLRHVALDFPGKRGETWEGFLNPHFKPCPLNETECFGGSTSGGKWLDGICSFLTLVGEQGSGRRSPTATFPHPYLSEFCNAVTTRGKYDMSSNDVRNYRCIERPRVVAPSRDIFDLVVAISGEEPGSFGFGGMSAWKVRQKLFAGLDIDEDTWGVCTVCKGEGVDPDAKVTFEAWEPHGPPEGPGWQVWETTSEGSPVSPVCASADELIEWLVQPEGTDEAWAERGFYGTGEPYCYSEQGQTRESAEAFVKGSGWVPSGASVNGGPVISGIAIAGLLHNDP